MPEIEPDIPQNAVSVYEQDNAEEFPVLKAFQQYIDAEQEKARKRMLSLAVFFGLFTLCVVAVFVVLLMYVSERNQKLNDRLVEFAMQQRSQSPVPAPSSPVVVQPPQDSSAILALTAKLDEMQKKLAADQAKAEREAKEAAARAEKAAIEAARPKGPSKEELEIQKLMEQLKQREIEEARRIAEAKSLAKEKARLQKEAERKAEIEAYRRKYYPELYKKTTKKKRAVVEEDVDVDDETTEDVSSLLKELEENKAIRYFDEEEEDEKEVKSPSHTTKKNYSIPVDDEGSSNRSWSIPED